MPKRFGFEFQRNASITSGASACIRANSRQRERALEFFTGENYPGEIGMLKPFDEPGGDGAIVLDDVEQDRPAVSNDHDLAGFRSLLERGHGVEARRAQSRREIDAALDRGETVIGDNEDVGCLPRLLLRKRIENERRDCGPSCGWRPWKPPRPGSIRAE